MSSAARCWISLPKSFWSAASGGASPAAWRRGRMRRVCAPPRRLDPGLRDPLAEGSEVGPSPLAAAPVEVGERARAVLEPHLEVEGPERAALVGECAADDRPAAVDRADD